MLELLKQHFDITPEASVYDGIHVRYYLKDSLYTIIAVTHLEERALIEFYEMSEHMANYGDQKVSTFVRAKNGKFLVTHDKQDFVVLHNLQRKGRQSGNIGRKLAKFHERGRFLQAEIIINNHLGKWKTYWIQRLEQMEKVWAGISREHLKDDFELLFIETFPYYLGLCENAIQYLTDTDLDEVPLHSDQGTVCHQRFIHPIWQTSLEIRNPFDWVFDHKSRDIAEWIRERFLRNSKTIQLEINQFIHGYQSVTAISPYSWRLIYARLLFPLHYFDCVEEYFIIGSDWGKKQLEEKFKRIIRDTKDYELFLREFYRMAGTIDRNRPIVEWL